MGPVVILYFTCTFVESSFSDPSLVVKLYKMYTTSFYGSNLWDLFCENTNKIYTSWNNAIRILFNLHRKTHRYFIESFSDNIHVKTML